MKKVLLLLIAVIGLSSSLMAQKVVTGKVTDENQQPMGGVTVLVTGTLTGAFTDADGNYSITVPENSRTLTFSFVGYRTQEVEIGNLTTINVSMAVDVGMLEEVIVIGYGRSCRAASSPLSPNDSRRAR